MTTTTCPVCGTHFTPIRRQRFCRPACRQTAYQRAHQPATPTVTVPVARTRKDTTIYQCDECEQRYLAEQWCYDCNRPCTRIGPGGACPTATNPSRSKTCCQPPTNPHHPSEHRAPQLTPTRSPTMLADTSRWSHARDNTVVPSRWQTTTHDAPPNDVGCRKTRLYSFRSVAHIRWRIGDNAPDIHKWLCCVAVGVVHN